MHLATLTALRRLTCSVFFWTAWARVAIWGIGWICNNAQTLHPQSAMCRQMVEEKVPLYARSSRRAPQQCAVPVLLTRRRTLPGLRLLEWLKLPNSITASEFCTRIKLILH